MKKYLLIAIVIALVGGTGLWYWLQNRQKAAAAATPGTTTAQIARGTIASAINATGRVVSNQDVDIKCKASGTIVELPKDVSDPVEPGQLLVKLDPVDEKRNVDQAAVALQGSKAKHDQAQQNLEVAKQALETARGRATAALTSAKSKAADARSKANRRKELYEQNLASREDYESAESVAVQAEQDQALAQIAVEDLKTQELALRVKEQDVALAKAQVASDELTLANTNQRLIDTQVMAPPFDDDLSPPPATRPATRAATRPGAARSPKDGPTGSHHADRGPTTRVWLVSARNVQKGQIISSGITNVGGGTTILTLSDLSRIYVLASVDESDIGRIRLERKPRVEITVDAFRKPGSNEPEQFEGEVVRIATKGVNTSNVVTFEVKIEVTSANKLKLKPEMTANVRIITDQKDDILMVPLRAVTRKDGKATATVQKADNTTEERPIEVGRLTDGENLELKSGLEAGETVVVRKEENSRWRADGAPRPPAGMMPGGGGRGPR